MRSHLLFAFLLLPVFCWSQTDSTRNLAPITLDTLTVTSKSTTIKKVHLKGFPSYNGLEQTKAVITNSGELPQGTLKSVTFYFNTGLINHLKKRLKISYKDVELGLLIYKANDDGTLGEMVSGNDIKFIVRASHRGAYKVDASSLHVRDNHVFIGFSVLTDLPKDQNNIYVRYNETKLHNTYVRWKVPFMSDNWRKYPGDPMSELKMTIEIEQ
jgi:hypothetical protein